MGCRGIHNRFDNVRENTRGGSFKKGERLCTTCNIKIIVKENRCPCCNWLLRIRRKKKRTNEV